MEKTYYTVGELANLTGVSAKTIRHYHKKGLLEPEKTSEGGYRLYSRNSVELLQRILMLKYLDFSLEEIKELLKTEDTKETFQKQLQLLQAQRNHLDKVIAAVEEMQKIPESNKWDKLLDIMRITNEKEELINQYKESGNLQKRINIHAYSTATIDWFPWVFNGLNLQPNMKILELGCGTGTLWTTMREQLPQGLDITLTDYSEGMLQEAQKEIKARQQLYDQKNIHFHFLQMDAEHIKNEPDTYDRIIANHMLYHISDDHRHNVLQNCAANLKKQGMFYASTVGETHMNEFFDLLQSFDSKIEAPAWISAGFDLENGKEQLEKVFAHVEMEEHPNDLLVPDPDALCDYAKSLPGSTGRIIKQQENEFLSYLQDKASKEKPFFIHKSTGAFRAYKN